MKINVTKVVSAICKYDFLEDDKRGYQGECPLCGHGHEAYTPGPEDGCVQKFAKFLCEELKGIDYGKNRTDSRKAFR